MSVRYTAKNLAFKKCNMCKQILPIDNFEIATKDGYRRGNCKTCVCIKNFVKRKPERTEDDYWKWKNEIKEKKKLSNEGKRKCTCCGEIKLLTEFNKSGSKGYQPHCRVCTRAKFKTWHKKNNPEIRERSRKKNHNKENPPNVKPPLTPSRKRGLDHSDPK